MATPRHVLICGECPLPSGGETHARIWAQGPCPACQLFYCRKGACLKRLEVAEEDHRVACRHCGTSHYFSGSGFGKICLDPPIASVT